MTLLVAAAMGLFLAALPVSRASATQDMFIRDATVHTLTSAGVLEHGDVLVRNGRIVAVGVSLAPPPGVSVVEARGRPVTPGLCGGISSLGIQEIQGEPRTIDGDITLSSAQGHPWRPEFDVTLAFNPRSALLPITRMEGVTWTVLEPTSDSAMVAGQGAAVTLDGRYDAVLQGSHTLFIQLGSAGKQLSGGSRAAQFMLLEQAMREARTPDTTGRDGLLYPEGRKALARYIAGGRVVFRVARAADIREVVAFARSRGLRPIIEGGDEAWAVAETLAAAGVPVVLDTLSDLPSDFDRLGARLDNAARLQRAGVRIAISDGNLSANSYNMRNVRQLAGNAVAHGLPWEAALEAITVNPAEIFGIGAVRGRIAVGQIGDLVLWDGDPLEVTTNAEQVWIAGSAVEMRSRQTQLRDRYLKRLTQQ